MDIGEESGRIVDVGVHVSVLVALWTGGAGLSAPWLLEGEWLYWGVLGCASWLLLLVEAAKVLSLSALEVEGSSCAP